ncbi:MAG TPA: HEAT repeat domain-containing protein, partial [Candidatus Binataceae bacterium]
MTARREDDRPAGERPARLSDLLPDQSDHIAGLLADSDMSRRLDGLARLAREPVATRLSARVLAALVGCLGADSKTVQRRAADALAAAAGAAPRPRHGDDPGNLRGGEERRGDNRDARETDDVRGVRIETDSIVAAVRGALASADARLRWGAAYALGTLGAESFGAERADLDAMPALLEALGDPDGDVRWAAAE